MKIQSTRILKDIELRKGVELDFDTSQNTMLGIMLLQPDSNNYTSETFQLKIAEDEVIPTGTPMSLFQTSSFVAPNNRFFTLFRTRTTTNRKFKITADSVNPIPDTILILMLDKK
jgi:hypothetical protein